MPECGSHWRSLFAVLDRNSIRMASAGFSSICNRKLSKQLIELVPGGVTQGVMMNEMTRWKIGGPADYFVQPSSLGEVERLIGFLANQALPWLVMGHSTNLLVCDEGIRGVVVQISEPLSGLVINDNRVFAQAGIWVPYFAQDRQGWSFRG